jgi:tellurite resistance protein
MTPEERTIVRVLVAVAWVDGKMQDPEAGVVDGLLAGFDASTEEQAELTKWASSPRAVRDVDVAGLSAGDRETLFSNAVLLVFADGVADEREKAVLPELASFLGLDKVSAAGIVRSVLDGLRGALRNRSS